MKIVALNGLLGYGYSSEALDVAFSEKVDYLGVDAGSTDPGPYYLGSGKSFTDRNAVKRDLSLALPKALEHKAPFIIGTAGGAGSKLHVAWLKEILLEVAKEQNLHFTLGTVLSDVGAEYVLEKFKSGKLIDMSSEFPADRNNIMESTRIVSQVGMAPIIELLKKMLMSLFAEESATLLFMLLRVFMKGIIPDSAFIWQKLWNAVRCAPNLLQQPMLCKAICMMIILSFVLQIRFVNVR